MKNETNIYVYTYLDPPPSDYINTMATYHDTVTSIVESKLETCPTKEFFPLQN